MPKKVLLPIFKREYVSDFADEILKEDNELRKLVLQNPEYRTLLNEKVAEIFKKYSKLIKGAKIIDSWDRVTSAAGLAGDVVGPFTGGLGNILSAMEEIPELIPKVAYAVYYGAKTKDLKAIPYFAVAEAASFIPYIGDAIDMTNIYVERARKATKEKVKKDMREVLSSGLEGKVEGKKKKAA